MEEIWIERMTWLDIKEAMAAGKRRVLLVVGAMEQHGPHLPIGTDTFLGHALAERVARKLGDTLIAPVITIGYSVGHMPFPGTVTLSEDTLKRVIKESCESLAHHGFEEIVLLASHGGNYRAIQEVLPSLQEELAPVQVLASTDTESWLKHIQRMCRELDLDPARVGVHAAQGETSQMLAHQPELVHMDRAVEGFMGDASIRWRSRVPPPMDTMSPTGILGDARGATAELGEAFLESKAESLAEQIRQGRIE
jgi:creatinine amidohydrolase